MNQCIILIILLTRIIKKNYFLLFLDAEYCINDQHKFIKVEDWNEQSKDVKRYVTYVIIANKELIINFIFKYTY